MATQPTAPQIAPNHKDDGRYERIDGQWVERPVPIEKHAEIQLNLTLLLREKIKPLGGKALQSGPSPNQRPSAMPIRIT